VLNSTLTSGRVFPPTGGTINGGASLDVATTVAYILISNDGSAWTAVLQ
jgi:hypothetical protein